jgi:hypothetical protein
MADTGSLHHSPRLTPAEVQTLGRLVEADLRDQALTLADVQRTLEGGQAQGSPLYRAGAEGSDAQARRILQAAKAARQERVDTARALGTFQPTFRCRYCRATALGGRGVTLPNDRCPGRPGSAKAWHLWRLVTSSHITAQAKAQAQAGVR